MAEKVEMAIRGGLLGDVLSRPLYWLGRANLRVSPIGFRENDAQLWRTVRRNPAGGWAVPVSTGRADARRSPGLANAAA